MQSSGANRVPSPDPAPKAGAGAKPSAGAAGANAGAGAKPSAATPGANGGTPASQAEKRPHPQPIWPGPYKKERSRANPVTVMVSIAALLLALAGLYWISSMQNDLGRQRDSILSLEQENQKLAAQAEETATDARAANEALLEQQSLKQPGQPASTTAQQGAGSPDALKDALKPESSTGRPPTSDAGTSSLRAGHPGKRAEPEAVEPSSAYEPVVHIYSQAPARAQTPPAQTSRAQAPPMQAPPSGQASAGRTSPVHSGTSVAPLAPPRTQPAAAPPQPGANAQAHSAGPAGSTQPAGSQMAANGVRTGLFGNPAPVAARDVRSTAAGATGSAPTSGPRDYAINIAHPAPSSNPLAENIQRVAALQRHTSVPLTEFHVAAGSLTRPFPDTGIEARKLDPKHGTFRLLVVGSDSRSEQKGTVFEPMPVVDQSTGRHYRLTITNIQNNQLYGYLSEAR